jgi:T-box protein 20
VELKIVHKKIFLKIVFPKMSRDPMDGFLEQHLRSPLRLFPDPMMQIMQHDPELLEKARQHLQMWGRAPELLLPQMYQRPNIPAFNLNLWSQWPRPLANGFHRTSPTTLASPIPTSDPSSTMGSHSPDLLKGKQRFSPYPLPTSSCQPPESPDN